MVSEDQAGKAESLPFQAPQEPLSVEHLVEIATVVGERTDLWEDRLKQASSQERSYVDVFTNEHLGVWAIGWQDDEHDTGYHDHDRSKGAVYVVSGTIRREQLRLGDRPAGQAVEAGATFSFDNTFIHRMRKEPGAGPTVTIHTYSPPLKEAGQYGQCDDGLLHRTPTPAEEQLKPHGRQGTPTAHNGGAGEDAT